MPDSITNLKEDKNILKLLIALSIPAVISGLVDSLYNTVDSIFVGQYVGSDALAALSIISVIQLMYISIGVLFSIGNASIISRALGAHHPERVLASLTHAFWGLFCVSNIISFTILLNLEAFLQLIGASEVVLPYAREYGSIILWTGFILPINNMLLGAFRARGQAVQATYFNILGAGLNIGLDALFIMEFGWGVAGAAIATAISQSVVFIFAIRQVMKMYKTKFLLRHKEEISFPLLKEIITVGMPTGLRLILFVAVASVGNIILAKYGTEYLSSFGVFNRVLNLLAMINISLSIGAQPLIGINYGAQLYKRVKHIIFITLVTGFIMSVSASLFLYMAPNMIFSLFTPDKNIVLLCQQISRMHSYTFWAWGIFICIAEALQAMGHAKQSFYLSVSYPLMMGTLFVLFDHLWGIDRLFWAPATAFLLIGILAVIVLIIDLKKLDFKIEHLKNAY